MKYIFVHSICGVDINTSGKMNGKHSASGSNKEAVKL
jgi:hypothetical protein